MFVLNYRYTHLKDVKLATFVGIVFGDQLSKELNAKVRLTTFTDKLKITILFCEVKVSMETNRHVCLKAK